MARVRCEAGGEGCRKPGAGAITVGVDGIVSIQGCPALLAGWTTDPTGQVEQMDYNVGGELVSQIDFMGRTTLHQYDLRGRRILTTHGDGRITQASYDAAGRRTSLSEGGNSWSWQYDARDRVTQPAGSFAGCAPGSAIDAMAS